MNPLSPEDLLELAVGALDEAFSYLCKLRNVYFDQAAVSQALRRTLKTIESLEEVVL